MKKQTVEEDLYDILGIDKDADENEIRKAYHEKSKENHPDKGGDHEVFVKISFAYSVLSDPDKRKEYDSYGTTSNTSEKEKAAVNLVKSIISNTISENCAMEGRVQFGTSRAGIAGIARTMNNVIKRQIAETKKVISNTEMTIEKLEKQVNKTRLKKKAKWKVDLYDSVIHEIIEQARDHKAKAENHLSMLELAMEIASDYEDVVISAKKQNMMLNW